MRQPLLAGLLMASSCWGYQQAAGNVMGDLPEEAAADLTGTFCCRGATLSMTYKDDLFW